MAIYLASMLEGVGCARKAFVGVNEDVSKRPDFDLIVGSVRIRAKHEKKENLFLFGRRGTREERDVTRFVAYLLSLSNATGRYTKETMSRRHQRVSVERSKRDGGL